MIWSTEQGWQPLFSLQGYFEDQMMWCIWKSCWPLAQFAKMFRKRKTLNPRYTHKSHALLIESLVSFKVRGMIWVSCLELVLQSDVYIAWPPNADTVNPGRGYLPGKVWGAQQMPLLSAAETRAPWWLAYRKLVIEYISWIYFDQKSDPTFTFSLILNSASIQYDAKQHFGKLGEIVPLLEARRVNAELAAILNLPLYPYPLQYNLAASSVKW